MNSDKEWPPAYKVTTNNRINKRKLINILLNVCAHNIRQSRGCHCATILILNGVRWWQKPRNGIIHLCFIFRSLQMYWICYWCRAALFIICWWAYDSFSTMSLPKMVDAELLCATNRKQHARLARKRHIYENWLMEWQNVLYHFGALFTNICVSSIQKYINERGNFVKCIAICWMCDDWVVVAVAGGRCGRRINGPLGYVQKEFISICFCDENIYVKHIHTYLM